MLDLKNISTVTSYINGDHEFLKLELQPEGFNPLVNELIDLLPNFYADPAAIARTLEMLGKAAAAEKIRIRIPETKKIRSGDIGEILATKFIDEETEYNVPIRKLRWRDHRNMAMRGDDVIGILVNPSSQSLRFLKAEAKGNRSLSRAVLEKAREELDSDQGMPAPHALSYISERLRETGHIELCDLIEKAQLVTGVSQNQVKHLLFTVTQSDPLSLQREAFEKYGGAVPQISVGVKVSGHQELINGVYQGVIDGLDD